MRTKLSVVIPCYNEENTLRECVEKLREIADEELCLEIIIVDDGSTDNSPEIGMELSENYNEVIFIRNKINRGKGAALRSGFKKVTGDFVAVQDADLEYSPQDLKNLLGPLINNKADVVIGSRFLTMGPHRILYFWHSLGNKFLTFLSNMFSNLNLTDMEAGYKIFKREVIKNISLEEDGFGFEPEIIAKISRQKLRIYEMGISYFGRTYEEGKKINYKDGFRALYCIFKYNTYFAPKPIKFLLYLSSGIATILLNVLFLVKLVSFGVRLELAVPIGFFLSGLINYPFIYFNLLGKRKKLLKSYTEFSVFAVVLVVFGFIDLQLTTFFMKSGIDIILAKIISITFIIILNFPTRKIWLRFGKREILHPEISIK